MEQILFQEKDFIIHEYNLEKEFEETIVNVAEHLFGDQSVYIDIKKRIGESIITIPDGYLIDFSFAKEPRLYIIENELASHDPYKHIGSQLLKFAISYKASGRKIKAFLLDHLMSSPPFLKKIESGLKGAGYRNIDDFLESIIFEKPVAAIVVIDIVTPELENVLSQLSMDTDILEFQTFKSGSEVIHKYTPFNAEIRNLDDNSKTSINIEEIDTIVVPAREEGFEEVFLAGSWYAIRISASMLDKIKYIAAYHVAPVSAITHYGEVASIEKWKDTNKYIVYMKEPPQKITPINLDKDKKGVAPQAPRYTSLARMLKSKVISEVF